MQMYPIEELAWAVLREREAEARQTRPLAQQLPQAREPLRSRLARALFHLALHLDSTLGAGLASAAIAAGKQKSCRV